MTGLSGRSRRLDPVTWTYVGSEGLFERDFEISKKNLHPAHVPYGGMFLEVKNPKNRTPKVILHPNTIFKNHHFVVIVRWVEETAAIAVYDKYVIWSSYY